MNSDKKQEENELQALNKVDVSGSTLLKSKLHDVITMNDEIDCCELCRYNQNCPSDVYKICLNELEPNQYYR